MKKYILLTACLFAMPHVFAQVSDRPTIASGGGYFEWSPYINFQSTIGEDVTQTIQSRELIFTQGFQQAEHSSAPESNKPSVVIVYPNPAINQLKVKFFLSTPAVVDFALINNAGQTMQTMKQSFSSGSQEFHFDFRVAAGLYLFTLTMDGKHLSTKVIVE